MRANKTEIINLDKTRPIPKEYICDCKYCSEYKGTLIRPNGKMYNRNERRDYMLFKHGKGGSGHVNPTPLHIARWAIQTLTRPGDIVIDPFMGCGTTAVESINHGRHAYGTEIDTFELARTNIKLNRDQGAPGKARVYDTDARKLWAYTKKNPLAQLMILHPPYSGDEQQNAKYDPSVKGNLAFMKESPAYWKTMGDIFGMGILGLKSKGYVVLGVKEMMRNKKWWTLHIKFNDLLNDFPELQYKGMILLPHYPRTLHMNTYFKRWGVHPSYYQTITIWRKI